MKSVEQIEKDSLAEIALVAGLTVEQVTKVAVNRLITDLFNEDGRMRRDEIPLVRHDSKMIERGRFGSVFDMQCRQAEQADAEIRESEGLAA